MSTSTAKRAGQVMQLSSLDTIFGIGEDTQNDVIDIKLEQLIPYKNRPQKTILNNDMVKLIESIFEHGLEMPILVREADPLSRSWTKRAFGFYEASADNSNSFGVKNPKE